MGFGALQLLKFFGKVGLAGGAVYVAYDQGLLGTSNQSEDALQRAKAALPPVVQEWADSLGWQLPAIPPIDFSVCESWNLGVKKTVSALGEAPTKICEYSQEGWKYMKDLTK
ncbi:MICOS complex subunit MIC13 [Rhinatrema bivittatum]|uniref:MICOS complex subunit MIC13 n=1 Tax=Rhinatrema bivittatum TaxID=194408 RepID=UPI00112BABD1|nr:MICOS complex subunit MIC13 [Rhinatrema bivittatum]